MIIPALKRSLKWGASGVVKGLYWQLHYVNVFFVQWIRIRYYVCGNIFCTLLMKHGVKMGHDDAPVYRGVLNLLQ